MNKDIRFMYAVVTALFCVLIMLPVVFAEEPAQRVKKEIITRYDINGRVVNQSQDAKGMHSVTGTSTLSSGVDTVSLNTSTADGKQDISFTDSTTYHGRAWSMDIANRAKVYSILPLSGTKFIVVSSDAGDVSTVYFSVEGE